MKNLTSLFLAPVLALALSACSDNGGGGNGPVCKSPNGLAPQCMNKDVKADEANNYKFSSTLSFPPIKVQPKAELTFEWGGLTKSFLGHPVAKDDVDMVSVLSWGMTLPDLEEGLNADTLFQSDLTTVPLTLTTDGNTAGIPAGATTAKTLEFTLNGTPIEPGTAVSPEIVLSYFDADEYPPEYTTYLAMVAKGTAVGEGTLMIQSFITDKSSTNTKVEIKNDSTKLTWKANLQELTPTGVPVGEPAINFDWTDSIETNALGGTFDPDSVTHVLLGRYDENVCGLETKFLDIELIATELYEADILVGNSVDLSTLTDKDGNKFPGISADGTWLLALQCGVCRNPAPWYLTILKPCE